MWYTTSLLEELLPMTIPLSQYWNIQTFKHTNENFWVIKHWYIPPTHSGFVLFVCCWTLPWAFTFWKVKYKYVNRLSKLKVQWKWEEGMSEYPAPQQHFLAMPPQEMLWNLVLQPPNWSQAGYEWISAQTGCLRTPDMLFFYNGRKAGSECNK